MSRCRWVIPSDRTLGSRIGGSHLGGRIRGSTFRCTLAAILAEQLELALTAPMVMTPGSEESLTLWMWDHLSVAVHPIEGRNSLASLEEFVLVVLDPPLNLNLGPPRLFALASPSFANSDG